MIVNNNNVLQALRSNFGVASREDAIALLDGYQNHQYGQFVVVKYGGSQEVPTSEDPLDKDTIQPVMVAVGVQYPNKYAIVFDGDLKAMVNSVEATDKAKAAGLDVSPIVGNVKVDLKWDCEYDEETKSMKIHDNPYFANIHRLLSTPVEELKTTFNQSDPTNFDEETKTNIWKQIADNVMILTYNKDNENMGFVSVCDLVVDGLYDGGVYKYWWQTEWDKKIAHPEIAAPSLRSIGKMKDILDANDKELSKRINDVHYALHDYAEWNAKNQNLSVFLNDGGELTILNPDGSTESVNIEDPLNVENLMCLYVDAPDTDTYTIDDEGILWRKRSERDSVWECPIPENSESLSRGSEWDSRYEDK